MSDNAELDRRTFLAATVAGAAACAGCPLAALGNDKRRRGGKDDDDAPAADPVDVGTAADYPRDGAVYDAYAKSHGFFLVRDGGTLYALGATCTHKKALLKSKSKALLCPKHGARFDTAGEVAKGPARRPLPRYAIAADDAGRITVDPSRVLEDDTRDDDAGRVRVD